MIRLSIDFPPILVLTFLSNQMPVMDGLTATRELRRTGVTTPIIGLTANADDKTHLESTRAGMNELLTKPVSMRALRGVLLRAGGGDESTH